MDPSASAEFLRALERSTAGRSRRAKALVAVSGGPDSTALLVGLAEIGFSRLFAVHVEHGMRGAAGRADAAWVVKLARKLGVPSTAEKVAAPALAAARGISLELAAREARHAALANAARRLGTRIVYLGHHADDQAETCLFRFLRGSGAAGLSGMRPETAIRVGRLSLRLVRPMLGIRRDTIEAFLADRRIRARRDATNASPAHARNRIRNELLPLARDIMGADPSPAIVRASRIFADEDAFLATQAETFGCPVELPARDLAALPTALQRRVIRRWLAVRTGFDPDFAEVERVRALLDPETGPAKANLAEGKSARRTAGRIYIDRG